jgi:hypothetical protein
MRRLSTVAVVTATLLALAVQPDSIRGWSPGALHAQEPFSLTGTWTGTWWMGKYEEPVELTLQQTREELAGHVTMWGYPTAGAASAPSTVRSAVTGRIEGTRVQLSWPVPDRGGFAVELTLTDPGTLFGAGGLDAITTGFGLTRSH